MRVISVNVGCPREIIWNGKTVSTSIFKVPVEGRVAIRGFNLDGDEQADLSVHGGREKAIYAYPAEHYSYWRELFPDMDLPWAMFGENLTTMGLSEDTVMIGDQFLIGTTRVMVTQPRLPCYKLGIRFGRDDVVKLFLESGRSGIYFSVLEEGDVAAGDSITLLERDDGSMSVAEIAGLFCDKHNLSALQRATELQKLPKLLREYLRRLLVSSTQQ